MEYGACLEHMRALRDQRARGEGQDTLLVVEHPPVATLGRRGGPDEVFDKTLPVFAIERGGRATYHAPGQLVLYPVMHLGKDNRDVRAFVRHLEALVHRLLADFGIESVTKTDLPGVWTVGSDKKIASIGLAFQQWVSFHGIALNVTLDPAEFQRIDPCGLGAAVMTNMALEGADADVDDVRAWVLQHAGPHLEAFKATAHSFSP